MLSLLISITYPSRLMYLSILPIHLRLSIYQDYIFLYDGNVFFLQCCLSIYNIMFTRITHLSKMNVFTGITQPYMIMCINSITHTFMLKCVNSISYQSMMRYLSVLPIHLWWRVNIYFLSIYDGVFTTIIYPSMAKCLPVLPAYLRWCAYQCCLLIYNYFPVLPIYLWEGNYQSSLSIYEYIFTSITYIYIQVLVIFIMIFCFLLSWLWNYLPIFLVCPR